MFRFKKNKAHFSKPDLTSEKAPRLMEVMEASQATAVAQVQAGDHAAFQALVEQNGLSLFRVAYRMTGSESDAEEIVQETFLRAYQQRKSFEARSNVGTWLYRIAVNASIDLLRKRKRHDAHLEPLESDEASAPVLSLASSSPAADRLVYSAQLGKRVAGVLEQLSSVERAAFILRHYEELSTEEIAQSLGLRVSAAKQAVFRAVQKMRKALEPWARLKQ
jgi:RNA polymerase sigma-70 factor, ECF subfamily